MKQEINQELLETGKALLAQVVTGDPERITYPVVRAFEEAISNAEGGL